MPWTWAEARKNVMVGIPLDNTSKELADFFISNTKGLPADILVIKTTMSYLLREEARELGLRQLQRIRTDMERQGGDAPEKSMFQKLITAYDRIPQSILIDCYSAKTHVDTHFLRGGRGMAHYNELITYWIIEGHLGPFERFEDGYNKGYQVLTSLLDCGLLRKLEDSYVTPSSELWFDFDSLEYNDMYGKVVLGMGNTFNCKFGKMALADGIMRTVAGRQEEDRMRGEDKKQGENKLRDAELKAGEKMVTLMLDGNHFELPDNSFFELSPTDLSKRGFLPLQLQNLAVFYPTVHPFPLPVDHLKELRLLVLRGCSYLDEWVEQQHDDKNCTKKSLFKKPTPEPPVQVPEKNHSAPEPPVQVPEKNLSTPEPPVQVLEISGPSPLGDLPEWIFVTMHQLKSVNLSGLKMTKLPDSFYKLAEVEYLILRGCPELKRLESLEKFSKLELLDASGSVKLETFAQKNFKHNQKLRVVNFSRTYLDRIPLISSLPVLESLILSDCEDLRGIRKVDSQHKLRILNIAGAKKVEEFIDPIVNNLESIDLLDVSRTAMRRLPGRVGNPRFLLMKDCPKLKELLPIKDLGRVQVLDASGSRKLEIINKRFMETMQSLRELNLSKTGIVELPPLPNPCSLHRLWLSDCPSLKKLDGLSNMEHLEELDLSGCKALEEMERHLFQKMSWLQKLSLSRLQLKELPSFSGKGLKRLETLHVEDCPNVKILPDVGTIPALKLLNHSGTTLNFRPDFNPNSPTVVGPIAPSEKINPKAFLEDLGSEKINPKAFLEDLGANAMDELESLDVQQEHQCNWRICSWKGDEGNSIQKSNNVEGIHFLQLLKLRPLLLEVLLKECYRKFPLWLVPSEDARVELPDESTYKTELDMRSLYLQQVFKTDNKLQRCLEIRGFMHSPKHAEPLLKAAGSIALIDCPFFKYLFDLGSEGDMAMEVCWIERCNEMEYLIKSSEARGDLESKFFSNLKTLWFSHAMKLKKISDSHTSQFRFTGLTTLYLEFCPELYSISSFEVLTRLETLYIRNCKKLKNLSEDESAVLKSLKEIHLWGLPMLQEIVLKAPCLNKMRVGDCCELKHVLRDPDDYGELKTLQIKLCENLSTICQPSGKDLSTCLKELRELELWALPNLPSVSGNLEKLQILKVVECHSLESLPELPKGLETLKVKSCEKLERIGEPEGVIAGIKILELICLPELLNTIKRPTDCMIWGCPKIKVEEIHDA